MWKFKTKKNGGKCAHLQSQSLGGKSVVLLVLRSWHVLLLVGLERMLWNEGSV